MKPQIWAQLKNLTADEIIHPPIHYHPGKTYGPHLLSDLLKKIGWTTADLKRLKLIK